MNQKYYSVNQNNLNKNKTDNFSSKDVLQEKELKEIYDIHYNDIFPKILSKTNTEFISLLKEKVSLHLKIINKTISSSLNLKYAEIFTNKCINDKIKVSKGLEDLTKNINNIKEKYLDILSCYIHCHKCSKILHKCKNRIIYYQNYIYCLQCKKVYNQYQIKLYCPECKVIYYSKLRYVLNKKYEYFYQVAFKQYHCPIVDQEKMKCLECGQDLYYNINCEENKNGANAIKEIFCIKCKFLYNINDIYFNCKICKNNFKSEAVFYNSFSPIRQQVLLIINILSNKKKALPDIYYNRKCKCNLTKCDKYLHDIDGGILYLGINLDGQFIITCDECLTIFKYNDFTWKCPLCKILFKSKKIYSKEDYQKILAGYIGEKNSIKESLNKPPSHTDTINKVVPKMRLNINLSNIMKDITKKNTFEDYNTCIIESYARNKKVIRNIINRKNNKYLNGQKIMIYKKIKDDKNILNQNDTERNYKLRNMFDNENIINTNKKYFNFFSNYSYINNKSETNSSNREFIENKESNKSTAHMTFKNNDGISLNDVNIYTCNCPSCILEKEIKFKTKNYNNNNNNNKDRINKKLINDAFLKNKNNLYALNKNKEFNYKLLKINENGNNSKKKVLQKCKTIIGKENLLNNNNKNFYIRRVYSKEDLIKNINDEIREYKSKKYIKKEQFIIRAHSKENIRKTELKMNKSLESRSIQKKIESRGRTEFKGRDWLKSHELKNESKRDNYQNNNKEIKKNENKKENNISKTDKKLKKNIKSFILSKINLNRKKIDNKKLFLSFLNNGNKNNTLESSVENSNYQNIYKTEANKDNPIIKIKAGHERNAKHLKYQIKDNKKIKEVNEQKKFLNKRINNNLNKSEKNIPNLANNKFKKYYEECANEECKKNILLHSTNYGEKYKRNSLEKKFKYISDFNSDNYTIIKLLGRGTFGKTYLVEDSKTKERFALKKIILNDIYELRDNEDEYNFILRLNKEYPDLKVINIYGIEYKNIDKYTTIMYVLMEAANCDWEKELLSRCKTRFYYTENQLIQILSNLVWTFAVLQKKSISHRDIKPQNILNFGNNEYKISDFGEAKRIQNMQMINKGNNKNSYLYQNNTMKQTLRGTELYMSPVLFLALRSHNSYRIVEYNSFKSDVFSLGMCLFLASSLNYEGLYEIREIIKNPNKTKLVVNRYLGKRYSQKYINLLVSMLQINEKDRPDFIELEKLLKI